MIDFHTHIFPDKIAGKTIEYLASRCGTTPFLNGTKERLLSSMDEAKIEKSILLPVLTSPSQFESVYRFVSQFLEGRLVSFGGLHPDDEDYKTKLRMIKNQGHKGVKFHPDYQNTYFSDMKYKRIISYATELDLICVVHAGQDPYSPNDIHCTPKMISDLMDDVKPTKLVLAHMGGNLLVEDVKNYLVGRDVYFDTAYVLDKLPKQTVVDLCRSHGVDKILFGSDSPWGGQKEFIEHFNSLSFSEEEKNKILGLNARRLLKDCI